MPGQAEKKEKQIHYSKAKKFNEVIYFIAIEKAKLRATGGRKITISQKKFVEGRVAFSKIRH